MRPRCKDCHNNKERGHRREWKRNYLRRWRKKNAQLNESYWKDNAAVRERARINAAARNAKHRDAILIQGRMNRRGMGITLKEAQQLLHKFGVCYPSRFGLTGGGLRECERLRSVMCKRPKHKRLTAFEIRLMVYEDGRHVTPSRQQRPYQSSGEALRRWWQARRAERLAA